MKDYGEAVVEWKPTMMYCPNCGNLVVGSRNDKGMAKLKCRVCCLSIVSKQKTRRHETVDLYAPAGQVALN